MSVLHPTILRIYGCASKHAATVSVVEMFKNSVLWQGEVEVFELVEHATADRCFAWKYRDEHGCIEYAAVLQVPPIHSANDAVRAKLAARTRGRFF